MKSYAFIFLLGAVLISMSFKPVRPELRYGTYGVCDNKGMYLNHIRLCINADATFQYTDRSNPKKPVQTSGTWERKGNVLQLKNYISPYKIHDTWKLQEGGLCVKSRKGLLFYRLCGC